MSGDFSGSQLSLAMAVLFCFVEAFLLLDRKRQTAGYSHTIVVLLIVALFSIGSPRTIEMAFAQMRLSFSALSLGEERSDPKTLDALSEKIADKVTPLVVSKVVKEVGDQVVERIRKEAVDSSAAIDALRKDVAAERIQAAVVKGVTPELSRLISLHAEAIQNSVDAAASDLKSRLAALNDQNLQKAAP
ncbi:MAG: hypothetical protein HY055_12915 [Magnetospirillum sp.]|nr:hypothetical protein [Magnetospirillum sp.]